MSFGSNTRAWHYPGSLVPSPLPFSFPRVKVNLVSACLASPVGNLLPGSRAPAWLGAKLALASISLCISGNRLFHQHLFQEGVCLDFNRCQPRQGVFFHQCVLPETKYFERPFSLKKVGKGKWNCRGYPNTAPSPDPEQVSSSCTASRERSLPVSAARAAPSLRGMCSDSAALLAQLRPIVRPGPGLGRSCRSPARSCPFVRASAAGSACGPRESLLPNPDSPALHTASTSSEIETVRKLVVSPRNHSLGFFFFLLFVWVFFF